MRAIKTWGFLFLFCRYSGLTKTSRRLPRLGSKRTIL
ncbi:branched-chain amino acid permease [Neisseria meningitidis]|nr:branched-chain amino acid permease [Neisseria meningitidis]